MRKQNYGNIIAGALKGRKIIYSLAPELRPTRRMLREAIFSAIYTQTEKFEGMRVVDAFCGSGLMGFEFLSRGAAFVDFVDSHQLNAVQFQKNIAPFRSAIEKQFRYWQGNVAWFFSHVGEAVTWDVVWMDPPFAYVPEGEINTVLAKKRAILFGVHMHRKQQEIYHVILARYASEYEVVYHNVFGESAVHLLRCKETAGG